MKHHASIAVIIPTLNEEQSIGRVIAAIPEWVDRIVVVDNGSSDGTSAVAAEQGARVVREPKRGYGAACLRGIAEADFADILVFIDADYSDFPEQMDRIIEPILRGEADMVIGSRTLGRRERGSLSAVQRFGNALSCFLIRRLYGHHYSDLGPFRAIRRSALDCLRMDDRNYGWTIQMQIRAVQAALRVCEVPVDYRRRIGRSKISGTIRGVIGAGTKILTTVFRERFKQTSLRPYPVRPDHLIVFTRYPEPGKTKTRLIPALGADGAAELHRDLTTDTLHTVEQLRMTRDVSIEVRGTGASTESLAAQFGEHHSYILQGGGDLGVRMDRAFRDAFARGVGRVVVIGTDCPSLDAATLNEAFESLVENDLVVGPALDGGYYLIGLRQPVSELFDCIEWGTERVLGETIQRATTAGLSVRRLPSRMDIDEPCDLAEWERHRRPSMSVIVPALNEARQLGQCLGNARAAEGVEIVVVDGGSTDNTVDIAKAAGVRVIQSAPGRARQMNAGALTARCKILLFLHADTLLPSGYVDAVESMLASPRAVLAAFRLGIDDGRLRFRLTEAAANARSRWMRLPYGDQAFAMRAADFFRLGGFRDIPIMEDHDLARRAAREGRIIIARSAVRTSARRWCRRGWLQLTLIHQVCIMAYRLGVSPTRIAAWREGRDARRVDESKDPAMGENIPVSVKPIEATQPSSVAASSQQRHLDASLSTRVASRR